MAYQIVVMLSSTMNQLVSVMILLVIIKYSYNHQWLLTAMMCTDHHPMVNMIRSGLVVEIASTGESHDGVVNHHHPQAIQKQQLEPNH